MIEHDPDLGLSKNFKLREFLISEAYPEVFEGLELTEDQILKLQYLCAFSLQPVRERFGRVIITSGYRPVVLNTKIKGAKNSQHMTCEAVDFYCPDADEMEVYGYLTVDLEWPGQVFCYRARGHIHVALPRDGVRATQAIIEG